MQGIGIYLSIGTDIKEQELPLTDIPISLMISKFSSAMLFLVLSAGGLILPRLLNILQEAPSTNTSYLYLVISAPTFITTSQSLRGMLQSLRPPRWIPLQMPQGRTLRHTKPLAVSARAGARYP